MMIVAGLHGKLPTGYFAEPWVRPGASTSAHCEVRIHDESRRYRLAAVVKIVSPPNKDRPERRRSVIGNCATLLREGVSVVIIDPVTTCTPNLYSELLYLIGQSDPALSPGTPPLYTAACRMTKRGEEWALEAWAEPLGLGQLLPTVPVWL